MSGAREGVTEGHQVLKHVWYDCKCNRTGCQFCDGGLGWCTVCDAFEGQLLPECPGRKLTPAENDKNYADNIAHWKALAAQGGTRA
jgi:hypothetical protein